MKTRIALLLAAALTCSCLFLQACGERKQDPKAEAPPAATVEPDLDANNFKVDHPEQFPLFTAVEHKAAPSLNVTGVVQPDIARAVPVISLAAGRVVEIKARLGDVVKKGQLLLRVQSNDVAGAYHSYRKAVNDELLARIQLERSQLLYSKGAIAKSALEQAEDIAQNAKADLDASLEQLRLLGIDKDHPSGIVNIVAPISGVITDQQVTNASGVQGLGSPNPFTISDLSYVWIICDVYENDLDAVHSGEYADIHFSAAIALKASAPAKTNPITRFITITCSPFSHTPRSISKQCTCVAVLKPRHRQTPQAGQRSHRSRPSTRLDSEPRP